VSSLSGNLQRFGMERVAKVESLQEIIAEMTDSAETSNKTPQIVSYTGQTMLDEDDSGSVALACSQTDDMPAPTNMMLCSL
jgi:hypothetical protein